MPSPPRGRLIVLTVAILLSAACRAGEAPKARAAGAGSPARSVHPAARAVPAERVHVATNLTTVVFEDEVERTPKMPARSNRGNAPPSAPARFSEIAASLSAQLASRDAIQWNAARPLQWSDFQGEPEESGRDAALSVTGQISALACDGGKFEYGVIAAFVPAESWVKPMVARNAMQSARVLAHEQVHFDITEIAARGMRRSLGMAERPCDMSDAERNAEGERAFREEREMQERYDAETDHGRNAGAQARWQAWAGNTLNATAGFAAPIGVREN